MPSCAKEYCEKNITENEMFCDECMPKPHAFSCETLNKGGECPGTGLTEVQGDYCKGCKVTSAENSPNADD